MTNPSLSNWMSALKEPDRKRTRASPSGSYRWRDSLSSSDGTSTQRIRYSRGVSDCRSPSRMTGRELKRGDQPRSKKSASPSEISADRSPARSSDRAGGARGAYRGGPPAGRVERRGPRLEPVAQLVDGS